MCGSPGQWLMLIMRLVFEDKSNYCFKIMIRYKIFQSNDHCKIYSIYVCIYIYVTLLLYSIYMSITSTVNKLLESVISIGLLLCVSKQIRNVTSFMAVGRFQSFFCWKESSKVDSKKFKPHKFGNFGNTI